MNAQVLIDAIVRQTMVLIAQLSTADGVRSPLSHVADEVFVGLVRELERQKLGKKVIADMFGLALRSYQQKVQRLSESVTDRGVTLWGAVHAFLVERGSVSRSDILRHFKHDEEAKVRSILNDLVETGLVRRSGRGKDELEKIVPLPEPALERALEHLVADDRIRLESRPDGVYCVTERCLIPVGQAAGWEAAIVDHHRAVLKALAAKVVSGRHVSAAADEIGGTTLNFDLWPGHPHEREVRGLLARVRKDVVSLWEEVAAYNEIHRPEVTYSVSFYCGQNLSEEESS